MSDKPTAILYARVSTQEQARTGYSIEQQVRALRAYTAQNGLEVLEEVRDEGHSGATLDRPGLGRVMELVAGSGVSVVLAQDMDRLSRELWHYGYLKALFEEHGCALRALDDKDDGSPESEFMRDIKRGIAKMERAYIARRSRRGTQEKARKGRVVGAGPHLTAFGTTALGKSFPRSSPTNPSSRWSGVSSSLRRAATACGP